MGLRLANEGDLEIVLGLNKSLFEFEEKFGSTFNLEWTYSEKGKSYFKKRLGEEEGIVILAEEDSRVVGYLCGFIDNYSFRSINPIAEVENMFVMEKYRGKGIGSKLVNKFDEICRNRGVKRVRVGANSGNADAIKFYLAMGFDNFELYLEKPLL